MRIFSIRLVLVATALLSAAVESRAESWRGITPLKSTRADVERIFGKPLPGVVDFLSSYKLDDGQVRFHYSVKKLCREVDACRCMVPDNTVLEVIVEPKASLKFSTLNLARSRFDRLINPENTNETAYCDFEVGIIYNVSERDDVVLSLQYGASAQDCKDIMKRP